MKKQRIQVFDNNFGRHTVYDVEAYCVGGTDGVLAVFEHKSFPPDCVGFASGDDGNWWLDGVIHKHWLPKWIDALQAILTDNME